MPKHSVFSRRVPKVPKPAVHPAWRGIGCIFMVIIPIIAFFASNLIIKNIDQIPWLTIPGEMVVEKFSDPLIFVRILYTTLIALVLYFITSLITFILNSVLNPKRKGPYDI
jgi:hypothetical protein